MCIKAPCVCQRWWFASSACGVQMGTLTEDIETAVKLMRTGRIDYRVGRERHLQLVVGKVCVVVSEVHCVYSGAVLPRLLLYRSHHGHHSLCARLGCISYHLQKPLRAASMLGIMLGSDDILHYRPHMLLEYMCACMAKGWHCYSTNVSVGSTRFKHRYAQVESSRQASNVCLAQGLVWWMSHSS